MNSKNYVLLHHKDASPVVAVYEKITELQYKYVYYIGSDEKIHAVTPHFKTLKQLINDNNARFEHLSEQDFLYKYFDKLLEITPDKYNYFYSNMIDNMCKSLQKTIDENIIDILINENKKT